MFNKYLILILSIFILASCWAEKKIIERWDVKVVDWKIENKIKENKDVNEELSKTDKEALVEFEKDLDNLFSELEDE